MTSPTPTPFVIKTITDSKPTPATDELVTTHHTLHTTDGELAYTATTGRIVLRDDQVENKKFEGTTTKASIGVTAYTLDDANVTTRPVVFCFNGGPGSPSVWLHMGSVGPRIVDLGEVDDLTAPPYRLMDNEHTLLRAADVVVIDAMSTGYSRAAEGSTATDWHGYTADVEQFSELIRLWCTRQDRWMSPKYLLGESYGTIRAVSVAEKLQDDYGLYFNGIILLSSVLDFGSQDFENARWDESAINFLPSYAAIAWYHGKHEGTKLADVLREAEEFADGPYRLALAKGHRLADSERDEIASTLARLTGLSVDYIHRTRLLVEHQRFCEELLRDEGKVVGRLDGRFTTFARSGTDEMMDTDPCGDLTAGPFLACFHHYVRNELGSTEEMDYRISSQLWRSWSYKEFEGRPVNVTKCLERVLQANPHCQIRIEYGYYDLATPYYAARDMVNHLKVPAEVLERFEHSYFETGHMPYLHGPSRDRDLDEQCEFIRRTSGR